MFLLNNEYKLNNPKLIYKKENKHKIIQIHLTFEKKNSYQITKEELKLIKEKEYEGNINVCSIDLGIIEPITYNIKEIDFLKENRCLFILISYRSPARNFRHLASPENDTNNFFPASSHPPSSAKDFWR